MPRPPVPSSATAEATSHVASNRQGCGASCGEIALALHEHANAAACPNEHEIEDNHPRDGLHVFVVSHSYKSELACSTSCPIRRRLQHFVSMHEGHMNLQEAAAKVEAGIRAGSNGQMSAWSRWTSADHQTAKVLVGIVQTPKETRQIGHLLLTWQNEQPYIDMSALDAAFLPEITEHITRALNSSLPALKGQVEGVWCAQSFAVNDLSVASMTDMLLRLPHMKSMVATIGQGERSLIEFAQGMLGKLQEVAPELHKQVIDRLKSDVVLRGTSAFHWLMTAAEIKARPTRRAAPKLERIKREGIAPSTRTEDEVRAALMTFMQAMNASQRDVADSMGTSQDRVSAFILGKVKVSPQWLGRVERVISDHAKMRAEAPVKAECGGLY